jgi:L-ascorbate metabolism protein UlaG (beta-lactamase superfamily)
MIKPFFLSMKPTTDPLSWPDDQLTVCCLGHSTVLINHHGTWILTDPILVDTIGINIPIFGKTGLKRLTPLPIRVKALPKIDIVLISHAHMDHLDRESLGLLKRRKQTTAITPINTARLIENLRFGNVTELRCKETMKVGNVTIRAFPVRHPGARTPFDIDYANNKKNGMGCNAYLVDAAGSSFFFMGDTGFTRRFKGKFDGRKIDLAIAPIGGYNPWGPTVHANPRQAMRMAIDAGAKYILPIHWGTFAIGLEKPEEPIKLLQKATTNQPLEIASTRVGEPFSTG